jgi:hypothetical protein
MVASYDEFAAEHRGEHLSRFNRWCAVAGNSLGVVAAVSALVGRRKAGAALFALGSAILATGYVAEGNLPRSLTMLARHPIWAVRADFAVARATIMGSRPS